MKWLVKTNAKSKKLKRTAGLLKELVKVRKKMASIDIAVMEEAIRTQIIHNVKTKLDNIFIR